MKFIKTILLFLSLGVVVLPAFQKRFRVIRSKDLTGVFPTAVKPDFSPRSWWKGEFQDPYRLWLEENTGLRSDFVRLFNQFDFSLFSIPHAEKIIVGKEGYLFAEQYIRAWRGDDFVGRRYIDRKVGQLKFIQEKLWKEQGTLVLVIFTPDKGTFYPEFIPDRFTRNRNPITNYSYYRQRYEEAGINFIDFNRWFLDLKDTSRFPLYPKTGIHWSSYGALLAADSLAVYLEEKLKISLPEIVVDSTEVSSGLRDEDNDISRTMNLIWDIASPPMAYPRFHFRKDSTQARINALFIGDSFYWNWYNPGIIGNLFANESFWYYDREVYPEHRTSPLNTGRLSFLESIRYQKVIILLQTNAGYGDPGYSFTDRAYSYLFDGPSRIRYFMEQISRNPEWMEQVKKKAADADVTTDAMIRMDAIFLANQELLRKK